ncbi:MAG: nucleic acid-binding protein [Methanomicrobiales archaeon]|nr:nucleic acid-binding protein [Methanomicrobiales archaeon]
MSFHFALVDDLISREEFDERVEKKIEEAGGLLDDHTAAMLVVQELGRSHVKVAQISKRASVCSFFGKVLGSEPPREFRRSDGTMGMVARLVLGDETGQIPGVLWDDRAIGAADIENGDVLEVIGKPARAGVNEVHILDLRPSTCVISCNLSPGTSTVQERVESLEALLISLDHPREFNRKDGRVDQVVEGLIGTGQGTFRLVCWVPELVTPLAPPCTVRISNARQKDGLRGREYHLDIQSGIRLHSGEFTVPCTPLSEVREEGIYSVTGVIISEDPPRGFLRDGDVSWFRALTLSDGIVSCRMVLWGEKALQPLISSDRVTAYHVRAKRGKGGDLELQSGRGSVLRVLPLPLEECMFEGTIVPGQAGACIDNGVERYLFEGEYTPAAHLWVEGVRQGRRLIPLRQKNTCPDRDGLLARLRTL